MALFFASSSAQSVSNRTLDERVHAAIRLSESALYDARLIHAENLVSESRFDEIGPLTDEHRLRLTVQRHRVLRFKANLFMLPDNSQARLTELLTYLDFAEKLNEGNLKAEYLLTLSSAYRSARDSTQADKYEEQALEMFRKLSDYRRIMDIRAIRISRKHNQLLQAGKKEEILALIPLYEKEIESSLIYNRYAASFNTRHLAQIHRRQTQNYKEALKLFKQSLELRETIGFRPYIPASYSSLGDVYVRLGELENAVEMYTTSARLAEKIGFIRYEIDPLIKIGDIYVLEGHSAKAREYFEMAVKHARLRNYKAGVTEAEKKLGNL